MGWKLNLLMAAAAVVLSLLVWRLTGGAVVFFFLPLLFGLPLLGRRRPTDEP